MKRFLIMATVLISCAVALAFTSRAENTTIKGDYVEVRTASVFAGACHFNGEVVTTGREAMMAWNFASGRWSGTDLSGLKAIAVVSADANLENAEAVRRTEIILDNSANHDQKVAMLEALKSRYAATLGEIVSVRSAPINFKHEGKSYQVSSAEAAIDVEAMANDLCCRQPNLVWYSPLVQLSGRKVGYTLKATYSGKTVGDSWERDGENSAFYGSFAF
ncbi:MAG TPA: DUF1326 domain-containing protein [Pyrinomonadaceae bacterium]|jgi:hypothetical protein|nr:DUF1326 domain-containing protein [Pyrinomonadaceae bacterium]